jgi:ABC-type branched-subunit amino acid transport system substrate-binding protein
VQGVAASISVPKKTVTITPSASSDGLVHLQVGGYLERTVTPDHLQGEALANVIASELHGAKGKVVNVGAFKSIYGKGVAGDFAKAWKKLGARWARSSSMSRTCRATRRRRRS